VTAIIIAVGVLLVIGGIIAFAEFVFLAAIRNIDDDTRP